MVLANAASRTPHRLRQVSRYVLTCMFIHIYIYTHIYVCAYAVLASAASRTPHMLRQISRSKHYIYIYIQIQLYIHTYIHIYIYIYICICGVGDRSKPNATHAKIDKQIKPIFIHIYIYAYVVLASAASRTPHMLRQISRSTNLYIYIYIYVHICCWRAQRAERRIW